MLLGDLQARVGVLFIEVCDTEKLSGYLMIIDFEKAFDSMNL